MALSDEQFIAHVDTTLLHHLRLPILGILARHYVEQLELRYFLDELLATGTWFSVRAVPNRSRADDAPSEFDVFGRAHFSPADARLISSPSRIRGLN
jgi:hypothetical protein